MMTMFIVKLTSNTVLLLEVWVENPRRKFAAVEKELNKQGVETARIVKITEV